MTADEARSILIAQAIEQSDSDERVLSDADRREASSIAGAPLPGDLRTAAEDSFLRERADILITRTASRFPEAADWIRRPKTDHRFKIVSVVLLASAAVLGFLTNELGPDKRINILSFPLLGILAWSVLVYLREVYLLLRKDRMGDSWISSLGSWIENEKGKSADPPSSEPSAELRAAETLFRDRWRRITTPLQTARVKSLLHLVALVLAAAAIAGMYVNGLANEYRAVWESTFFPDGNSLLPFLRTVLGPAAALTGDSLPTAEELDLIRWRATEAEVAGENAARWIHWYAITIGLFVLLPRAILSLLWKGRATLGLRNLPFREVSPSYFDHIIATSSGSALSIHVIPYSFEPDQELREAVLRRLESHFQRPVDIHWAPSIPFGEEEGFSLPEGDSAHFIPLFSFSATPEKETHRALINSMRESGGERVSLLLLDTLSFDSKNESLADASERRRKREEAWQFLLEGSEVELILLQPHPDSDRSPD